MNINQRLKRLGMTQKKIGIAVGIPARSAQPTVSAIAHGASSIYRESVMAALAKLEADSGIRPPRDHRLAERRRALGRTRREIAEWSGFECSFVGDQRVRDAEYGCSSDKDVQAVRRTIVYLESEPRRERELLRRIERRTAAQAEAFAAVPASPEKLRLQTIMLHRCLELMTIGAGEACDAIAEFLPTDHVQRMFSLWEAQDALGISIDVKCLCCTPLQTRENHDRRTSHSGLSPATAG